MFITGWNVYARQAFPAKSNVCEKAWSLPYSGEPKRCFTRAGSGLTFKHYSKPESPAKDKHSSKLQTCLTY